MKRLTPKEALESPFFKGMKRPELEVELIEDVDVGLFQRRVGSSLWFHFNG